MDVKPRSAQELKLKEAEPNEREKKLTPKVFDKRPEWKRQTQ